MIIITMALCDMLSEVWGNYQYKVYCYESISQEIVEFLQIRGGYIGEFGKQRSLDITRLPKGPSNDPPESIPVRLTDLTG